MPPAAKALPALVELHQQGKFPIERMSKYYQFEDFDKAVHDMWVLAS